MSMKVAATSAKTELHTSTAYVTKVAQDDPDHQELHKDNRSYTSLSNSEGKPVSSNDVKGGGTLSP